MNHRLPASILLAAFAALGLIAAPAPLHAKAPATPTADAYYDEVFETLPDGTKRVRPYYAKVYEIYRNMTDAQKAAFLRKARRDFHGDNALDPLPRLIPQSEYNTLRKGIDQRSTALRMFLQDYYSGRHTYASIIPQSVVDRIVERAGESGYAGLVPPEQIAFPYGPDIVRAPDGAWHVLEDNPGYIGGPGDLKIALDTLLKEQPAYKDAFAVKNDPLDYWKAVVEQARARAVPKSGRVVVFMVPPYPDNEDLRLKEIYDSLGVDVVTPRSKDQLHVTSEGVWLRTTDEAGKPVQHRVGFVFMNEEHHNVDPTHSASWERLLHEEAHGQLDTPWLNKTSRRALEAALVPDPATGKVDLARLEKVIRKTNLLNDLGGVAHGTGGGLMKAMLEGRIPTNYAPGVDFIGDKEFYTYVDDLIRHYLHEEPAVPNLPTRRFARYGKDGKATVDQAVLDDVLGGKRYRNFVIKVVDGRGGDGIFIGPKLKPTDIPAIRRKILDHPESYVVQPFSHLSQVDDRIVDLRLITSVGPDGNVITKTPWGRGVPAVGNGKVNLSQQGREFAVVVVNDAPDGPGCLAAVRGLLRAARAH